MEAYMPDGQEQVQAQGQEQGQAARPAGSPQQVIEGIHEGMMVLMDMMEKSQSVSPQDKQGFQQIVQGFRAFVQGLGGQRQEQEAAPDTTSQEAGAAEAVPVG